MPRFDVEPIKHRYSSDSVEESMKSQSFRSYMQVSSASQNSSKVSMDPDFVCLSLRGSAGCQGE